MFLSGCQVLLMVVLANAFSAFGQTESEKAFDDLSFQYRTALYNDPLAETALEGLVKLYGERERLDELVGTYRSHIEQYPSDAGAKVVLIRVIQASNRPGFEELLASAVGLHPDYAPVQYLLFETQDAKGDERSLETLSRAIDLETNAGRKTEWLELLLERSGLEGRREVAEQQLSKVLQIEVMTYEEALSLARLMQRYEFWGASIEALKRASEGGVEGEAEVEVAILLSRALAKLNRGEEAGNTLDALLQKLATDHWRRREIMSLRINVVSSDEEREKLIERFRQQYEASPEEEGAILDLADLLVAAERHAEASELLVKSAALLPNSEAIEFKALELLRVSPDREGFEAFLEDRLELAPDRRDLRLELVKVRYGLGKDADAAQDFQAVVAGLSPEESSREVLELQRYLRSIDRQSAAVPYLEAFLDDNPERLDVARELMEVYLAKEMRSESDLLVGKLDAVGASSENVIDLLDYLLSIELFEGAKAIASTRLSQEPDNFPLGLALVRTLGELGDQAATSRQIALLRDRAESPVQYSQWLQAAIDAHTRLETLATFLDTEQNRFSFGDEEWPEEKVEKFIILCEAAKTKLSTERIAAGLRERLSRNALSGELRVRLQRFLLGLLENDPAAGTEAEGLLVELAKGQPERAQEYELRRALLFHRLQQLEQSQELIVGIDASQVAAANPLREGVEALIEYGFLSSAVEFLAAINQLEPEDVFSWSRRLSLLAARGDETEFREVARSLIREEGGVRLLPESKIQLQRQLINSYWRTVSRLLSENRYEEVLPVLAAVEREEQPFAQRAWIEWTRYVSLERLGRKEEAKGARDRFASLVSEGSLDEVVFPDGLTLQPETLLASDSVSEVTEVITDEAATSFLLGETELMWGFELPEATRLQAFWKEGGRVLILDENGTVYGLDSDEGRLLWTRKPGGEKGKSRGRPKSFRESPNGQNGYGKVSIGDSARTVRRFAYGGAHLFVAEDGRMSCHSDLDGSLVWSAELPFARHDQSEEASLGRDDVVVVSEDLVVAFRPATQEAAGYEVNGGKLRWVRERDQAVALPANGVDTLNSGAEIERGQVLLYGLRTEILDASNGALRWNLDPGELALLPVTLRKDRGQEERDEASPGAASELPAPLAVSVFDVHNSSGNLTSGLVHHTQDAGAIISPAVYWAHRRKDSRGPAFAHLGHDFLWLGYDAMIRRLPTDIPIGSHQQRGEGAFLGENGKHAWFLHDSGLNHVDFQRQRSFMIDVSDLGEANQRRALLSGNKVIVSGPNGLKVINAITGKVLVQSGWPEALKDYLGGTGVESSESPSKSYLVWQGRVTTEGSGASQLCRPVIDIIDDDGYLTAFDDRIVVRLGPSAKKEESSQAAAPVEE